MNIVKSTIFAIACLIASCQASAEKVYTHEEAQAVCAAGVNKMLSDLSEEVYCRGYGEAARESIRDTTENL